MNTLLIFLWVILAFIVMAFLERTIEGPHGWASKTYGKKFMITKNFCIREYHIWFWIFIIILISLPLAVFGFSLELFVILLSAFFLGMTTEDFLYFVVNPYFGLKKFNSKNVKWHFWLKLGKFEIPISYILCIIIAVLSWYFLWN